jgi:hypothetical protein
VELAVSESSSSFVTCRDIDIFVQELGEPFLDCTTIDHNEGAVVASGGHYDSVTPVRFALPQNCEKLTYPGMFLSHPGIEILAS